VQNIRTKAIGNMIDVIECFEERTSVATEAAEASNLSVPSVSSADSIAQLL